MTRLRTRILIAVVAVFVAAPLARWIFVADEPAVESQAKPVPTPPAPLPVQAIVSRESAEGFTDRNIDLISMVKIEKQTLERFHTGLQSELDKQGKVFASDRVTASSVIAEVGGRRMVVTKMKADGQELAAQVFGIVGSEAIRIGCFSQTPGQDVVMSPECRAKVQEVFGVDLGLGGGRG